MSERSRRRRRRRRTGSAGAGETQRRAERETPDGQPVAREQAAGLTRARRRRRGRPRTGQERAAAPKSSEDLVRALPRERPATLTAPPDGQTLEGLVGDLQSEFGVPQYPQEYRITLKVADEKERAERAQSEEGQARVAPPPNPPAAGSPRREKAPAMNAAPTDPAREQSPGASPRGRPRRRRRRRRGTGGAGPTPST
jgi:hypothetical protein